MSSVPVISVIMPVYNTGSYLREAVDSILAQTFGDFELLLIDDGSTDGSSEICDEYAASDRRVIVRHGRNGGICASRNVGLSMVRGEWLAFSDHDDVVDPDWLRLMLEAARRYGVPVVKCNHTWDDRSADGRVLTHHKPKERRTCCWTRGDLVGERGYFLFMDLGSLVWDGLYRTDFWRRTELSFSERFKYGGEDCYLGVDIISSAGRGVWLEEPLYHHFFNYGLSTASSYHPEMIGVQLEIARHEKDVLGYSSCQELLAMFKRWSGHLRLFVFNIPGCPLSLAQRAELLQRYFDEIVGGNLPLRISELDSPGLRVLAFFMQRRWFAAWLIILFLRDRVKWVLGK